MTAHFVINGVFLLAFVRHISGDSYPIHSNVILRCNTTNVRKSMWTDDCNDFQHIIYFSYVRHSVLPKYDNFFISEEGFYDLVIHNATEEDEGCYKCKTDELLLEQETLKIEDVKQMFNVEDK